MAGFEFPDQVGYEMSDATGSLDVEREDEWLRGGGEKGEFEIGSMGYDEPRRRGEESEIDEEGHG
jgi:hypothetical protein